ncbi:hypothetical protein HUB98_27445 [Paenibacillus barcinonensis]|uniref:Uncharacterized protein n=1 Tax=Paenibacillus barcinonensis TaxID=198119 RepID=A0A2V4VEY7_PAEBA|nr:hypothetical protein [Paenibacillus barcinonensis]PYE52306.1 hypothetical protein DFQ00_101239 [Paenibacillus barcinonensis]QKS59571.1 hypothetical protein HUB98_27445 [Paenibacillus barcinonensis]
MSRTRLVFSGGLLVFAIIFTFNHHLGFSVGDSLLLSIGISPYTKSYVSGVHITIFFGLGMLACGYYLARKEIMLRYPLVARTLWIAVVIVVSSYSFMTDKLMYVVKWGATGLNGISYTQNNSSCTYHVHPNGRVHATCELTLKNYSSSSIAAMVKPDLAGSYRHDDDALSESLHSVALSAVPVKLEPRMTFTGTLEFSGLAKRPLEVSGKLDEIVLDVAVDGSNTVFDYDIP